MAINQQRVNAMKAFLQSTPTAPAPTQSAAPSRVDQMKAFLAKPAPAPLTGKQQRLAKATSGVSAPAPADATGYQDTGGVLGFLKARANQLNESLDRASQGKQGPIQTTVQAAGNTVVGPAMDILGKVLAPLDFVRKTVLNQGAGRIANIITGKGNKPVEDKSPLDYVKNPATKDTLEGILNLGQAALTVAGGAKGSAEVDAAKARTSAAKTVTDAAKADSVAGKIVQGSTEDIHAAKNALSNVDLSKIKTEKDLLTELKTNEKKLVDAKGKALESRAGNYKLPDLATKVGNTTHNFVQDAIDQLHTYYTKTNDVAGQSAMDSLRTKAATDGLTIKQIDDLAVLHGQDLSGFNANGELASGLSKQAAENTRTGVKATARDLFGHEAYKSVDTQLSHTINTRKLIETRVEEVNKLRQKIIERKLGEKVGRFAWKALNFVSRGALKGFTDAILPRGEGYKTLNAIDLEASLQKDIKTFQKLNRAGTSDAEIIKTLENVAKENEGKPAPPTKGETTTSTAVPQKLERFKVNPKKPVKVSNYQNDYPNYITPDQVEHQTKVLRYRENASKPIDMKTTRVTRRHGQ